MKPPERKLRVLVVGSLPPPFGGCSVTLQYLVDELRRRDDVEVHVLDTKGIRGHGFPGLLRFGSALWELARLTRRVDLVTLHVATTALPIWGLIVHSLARSAGRPFIVRKFGGADYWQLGSLSGRLAHYVASHSDVYLVETRSLLEASRERGVHNPHWFPTTRPTSGSASHGPREGCRRFVYVGHVRRSKGLVELVEAMRRMPPGVSLDVYGPWFQDLRARRLGCNDDVPKDLFDACPGVTYRGALAPGEVVKTISRYDAFVLPSLAATEGYPGTVLEACAAGLPIIASRIGAIPEIVDDRVGLLVEPGDVQQLRKAMQRLVSDRILYRSLCAGVSTRADEFSSEHWSQKFVQHCRGAVDNVVNGLARS